MSKIEVRNSVINGQGVFATRTIMKGEAVLRINDSIVVDRADPVLGKLIGSEPDYCDYLADGRIVLMQDPERFINHSCDPNVYVYSLGKERFVLAMPDIAAGEEAVYDYAMNQVNGDWLDCHCGSPKCRGRHRPDFFSLPVTKQLEYLPYLGIPFVHLHQERILELPRTQAESSAADDVEDPPLSRDPMPPENVEMRAKIRPGQPADAQALDVFRGQMPVSQDRKRGSCPPNKSRARSLYRPEEFLLHLGREAAAVLSALKALRLSELDDRLPIRIGQPDVETPPLDHDARKAVLLPHSV